MSEEPVVNGVGGTDEQTDNVDDANAKKTVKYDSGAADLEKVTDYAEEKEVISTDDISGAMTIIGDRRLKEAADKIAKEKELQKVSIKKSDVELIIREMEISKTLAERTLRECHGDVVKALIVLTN
ncbi:PREDICTED: huntingtin-interacting protein K [Diuraphis noxia]|uniref:huntingtin-interacting protein K n=1 Tax=Diuraphis noxia TaxID=143948 RepID=UPI0007636F0B|nr:PREDICTED: huntingtin-interacting protein K [Diuraphis noxia]